MKNFKILSRYFLAALFSLNNLWIFYFIFSPITIYFSYFLLKLFYPVFISGNLILFGEKAIVLIDACIAGSAYYLLTILNLATPMNVKKRIFSLAFSYFSFLILNTIRIFFIAILFFNSNYYFEFFHKILWYSISIVFVVGIWFLSVYLFKIKSIPFYSDIKIFLNQIKNPKTSKKKN